MKNRLGITDAQLETLKLQIRAELNNGRPSIHYESKSIDPRPQKKRTSIPSPIGRNVLSGQAMETSEHILK